MSEYKIIIANGDPDYQPRGYREDDGTTSSTDEPPKIEELFEGFDTVMDFLVPLGVILAVIFAIIGGYMWMSSAGNPDKVKQAQGTLTWAIIGLVFITLVVLLLKTLFDYIVGM